MYVPESVQIGCEISFTRYVYKPKPMQTQDEINAEIAAVGGLLAREPVPVFRSCAFTPTPR